MKDNDGWIEWRGGKCPVPKGTLIDVGYRDGEYSYGVRALIDQLPIAWRHSKYSADIVAYRISKPCEPPKPDTSAEDALWHGYAGKALQGFLARADLADEIRNGADVFSAVADAADAMLAEAKKRGRV